MRCWGPKPPNTFLHLRLDERDEALTCTRRCRPLSERGNATLDERAFCQRRELQSRAAEQLSSSDEPTSFTRLAVRESAAPRHCSRCRSQ